MLLWPIGSRVPTICYWNETSPDSARFIGLEGEVEMNRGRLGWIGSFFNFVSFAQKEHAGKDQGRGEAGVKYGDKGSGH